MDNLSELSALITPLLSDPETMSSLRQAAEQMGLGGLLPDSLGAAPRNEEQASADGPAEHQTQSAAGALPTEMLTAVAKLAPLLSAPKEDNTTRLLAALRPFLSQERVRKLDEAEKLLSLTRMLSILKESKLM